MNADPLLHETEARTVEDPISETREDEAGSEADKPSRAGASVVSSSRPWRQ
jgi:hypothetical protein